MAESASRDRERRTRVRLFGAGGFLLCILAGGTLGFRWIEGWPLFDAFYMCLITITTIGYGEVHSLSAGGRVLNSLIILFGVGTFTYTVTQFMHLLVQEELLSFFNRRAMDKTIDNMDGHFIVCGAGRLGMRIALHLHTSESPFLVVESDPDVCERLAEHKMIFVEGDATDESVLTRAGVERARGLCTATGSDPHNVYISLTARDMNPSLYIVARANSIDVEPRLKRAGANRVITPERIGSRQMADALLRPGVIDFYDDVMESTEARINLEEVVVSEASPVAGTRLKDALIADLLSGNINVIMIRHADGETTYRPGGDTEISAGDRLIALGDRDGLEALKIAAQSD